MLMGAADLEAAVSLAKSAGFDVSKEDWIQYQMQSLGDEELEGVAGGWDVLSFGGKPSCGGVRLSVCSCLASQCRYRG